MVLERITSLSNVSLYFAQQWLHHLYVDSFVQTGSSTNLVLEGSDDESDDMKRQKIHDKIRMVFGEPTLKQCQKIIKDQYTSLPQLQRNKK
jgi:hypothetical protein